MSEGNDYVDDSAYRPTRAMAKARIAGKREKNAAKARKAKRAKLERYVEMLAPILDLAVASGLSLEQIAAHLREKRVAAPAFKDPRKGRRPVEECMWTKRQVIRVRARLHAIRRQRGSEWGRAKELQMKGTERFLRVMRARWPFTSSQSASGPSRYVRSLAQRFSVTAEDYPPLARSE